MMKYSNHYFFFLLIAWYTHVVIGGNVEKAINDLQKAIHETSVGEKGRSIQKRILIAEHVNKIAQTPWKDLSDIKIERTKSTTIACHVITYMVLAANKIISTDLDNDIFPKLVNCGLLDNNIIMPSNRNGTYHLPIRNAPTFIETTIKTFFPTFSEDNKIFLIMAFYFSFPDRIMAEFIKDTNDNKKITKAEKNIVLQRLLQYSVTSSARENTIKNLLTQPNIQQERADMNSNIFYPKKMQELLKTAVQLIEIEEKIKPQKKEEETKKKKQTEQQKTTEIPEKRTFFQKHKFKILGGVGVAAVIIGLLYNQNYKKVLRLKTK